MPDLDDETLAAARAFVVGLNGRYPVTRAVVFGSRARRDHGTESDLDLAIFLSGAPGNFARTTFALADIAYDLLLETGIRVEPYPIWEEEWDTPDIYANPALLENIRRDGIGL